MAAAPPTLTDRQPRRTAGLAGPAAVLGVFVLIAALAPLIAPHDPDAQNLLGRLKPPGTLVKGTLYLLGSDDLGRDNLSRLVYGARVSLFVAMASVLISGIIGTALGMLAAFYRGWLEIVIMRSVDIVLSVPALLLAIITVAVLGPGLINVVVILVLTRWPRYARVAHAQTLTVMNMPYLKLSRFMGAGWFRLLWRQVLPNILSALVVVATLEFGLMVLFEAGLSFLGLGVQPPTPSWGAMLAVGRNYVANAWWLATIPGLALSLLVLCVNLIGDRLRDRLEPQGK